MKKPEDHERLAPSARAQASTPTPLELQVRRYLEELGRTGASPHSIRAYESDLAQFIEYLSPPDLEPPEPRAIDLLILREWLASLYRDHLTAVTIRRKLAAV